MKKDREGKRKKEGEGEEIREEDGKGESLEKGLYGAGGGRGGGIWNVQLFS